MLGQVQVFYHFHGVKQPPPAPQAGWETSLAQAPIYVTDGGGGNTLREKRLVHSRHHVPD